MTVKSLRIEWLGKGQKKVELPIPYIQKCEKTGEVICNPIGEFPVEDGERLLEIAGTDGMFKLVEKIYDGDPAKTKSTSVNDGSKFYEGRTCACGCNEQIPIKESQKRTGIPRYLVGHSGKNNAKKGPTIKLTPSSPPL